MILRALKPALVFASWIGALTLAFPPGLASAESPHYTIGGFATLGTKNFTGSARDYGGGAILEAQFLDSDFRVGPALGAYYVSDSMGGIIATPLLVAASLELGERCVFGRLSARGGLAPLTLSDGFAVGGLFTVGARIEYRIDEIIALGLGVDALFVIGQYGRSDLAPILTLTIRPSS